MLDRWSIERVAGWQSEAGWLVGCNLAVVGGLLGMAWLAGWLLVGWLVGLHLFVGLVG